MDSRNRNNVCSVLLVEIVKIGLVLEIVGVKLAAVNNIVRLNIIVKFLDFQLNILFGKNFLCNGKYLSVRSRRSGDGYRLTLELIVINRGVETVRRVLNRAYNGAVIFCLYKINNLLAFESSFKSLYFIGIFIALLNCKNIAVCRGRTLYCKRIVNGIKLCGYSIV